MNAEQIYNAHLITSRSARNKPFRPRKDFTGFSNTPEWGMCKKLEVFFHKFPQINPNNYFLAPYELYKDEDYFPLNFYLTQKSISAYTINEKLKEEQLPDTENQITDIKNSLKTIAIKLSNSKLSLDQYCSLKGGYTYQIFEDYKNKLINIYVLIKLPKFNELLNTLSDSDKQIYLTNIHSNLAKFKLRLNNSIRAKYIVDTSLKLIEKNFKPIDNSLP